MSCWFHFRWATLVSLWFLAGNALGADCPWLPTSKIDQALPHLHPWKAGDASAAGHCDFSSYAAGQSGATAGYPKLTFTEQVHASASDARDSLKTLREEGNTADYTIQRLPALGAEAMVLLPTPRAMSPQTTSWMTHHDKVGLFVSWTGDRPLTDAERNAVQVLIAATQGAASQTNVMAQTSRCPYWDEKAVKKLLPGKEFRVQQLGVGQCGASVAGGGIVSLNFTTEEDSQSVETHMKARRSGFCRYLPLPEFGDSAALEHSCSTGPEQNTIIFATGRAVHTLGFDLRRKDAQPNAAQRELLLQVARSVVKIMNP